LRHSMMASTARMTARVLSRGIKTGRAARQTTSV
jgi:hypothetical protein